MSAPFQPDDVVVCIDASPCSSGSPFPLRRGSIWRIRQARYADLWGWGVNLFGEPALPPGKMGFRADRFRKIDDEQIPEVLERLKAIGKPKVKTLDPSRHSREMA